MKIYACAALLVAAALPPAFAAPPAAPYVNPFWAPGSAYSVAHSTADFTPYTGPVGPTRRLQPGEIIWKKIGPINGYAPMYSGPYPNGKKVVWVGGYDRVAKLDADTLAVLTTYAIGGNTYFGEEEIERHIAVMDRLDDKARAEYMMQLQARAYRSVSTAYHLLSKENEFYLPYRTAEGLVALRVYGDSDPQDPASDIEVRREWTIPREVSTATVMSVNMTSDGHVVMVTKDGVLIVLSQDFKRQVILKLPRLGQEGSEQDFFDAFVRNGLATDDRNGIFLVSRDAMMRVQWTGSRLSLDAADGAWSAPYDNEMKVGSGTSPALLGWGSDEDHLVVIADAKRGNNMMAFWRDEIPDDWKGLPGYDRRVAGITPISFGVSKDEQAQIENAPVVYGYGVFFNNTFPVKRQPDQGSPTKQWFAESMYMQVPGHEARGGTMIEWDPKARELRTAWRNQINYVSTVCTVSGSSGPNGIVYCWGARDRDWTLEGTDWKTGRSVFHYMLGPGTRFNPLGGPIIVTPSGAVDCACSGGLGMVRIKPAKR